MTEEEPIIPKYLLFKVVEALSAKRVSTEVASIMVELTVDSLDQN
jgi:hypothetical protein